MVHRSDGSGTTYIFTDYLSKVSKDWADGPGKGTSLSWPVGVGGKGNEGVAGLVRQLPGAIGYVELIYALAEPHQLRRSEERGRQLGQGLHRRRHRGRGQHQADARRLPRLHHQRSRRQCLSDLQLHLAAGSGQTDDPAKGKVLKDMLSWIVNSGESEVSSLSYAPLPKSVAEKVLKTVYSLQ